jgi:flagella basal body P-ring formation protein FlgA
MQRWLLTILLCVGSSLAMPATAQAPAVQGSAARGAAASGSAESIRRFVEAQMAPVDGATRMQIVVGQPDPRLQLAPCERAEPFLRAGVRLWGKTFVGLRCAAGAEWSISVPVEVRIYGPGLRAVRELPAGQPIGQADVAIEEVEWTREPQGVAASLAQIDGRVPVRPIEAGRIIGLAAVRELPAVTQGDAVKLVGVGQGFSIVTDAVALGSAALGQPVRIRTDAGRMLTGTARTGRVVEVVF